MSHAYQQTLTATPRRFPTFRFWRSAGRRPQRLDLAALPEHMKRDLGFAGGHATPPRDIFRD